MSSEKASRSRATTREHELARLCDQPGAALSLRCVEGLAEGGGILARVAARIEAVARIVHVEVGVALQRRGFERNRRIEAGERGERLPEVGIDENEPRRRQEPGQPRAVAGGDLFRPLAGGGAVLRHVLVEGGKPPALPVAGQNDAPDARFLAQAANRRADGLRLDFIAGEAKRAVRGGRVGAQRQIAALGEPAAHDVPQRGGEGVNENDSRACGLAARLRRPEQALSVAAERDERRHGRLQRHRLGLRNLGRNGRGPRLRLRCSRRHHGDDAEGARDRSPSHQQASRRTAAADTRLHIHSRKHGRKHALKLLMGEKGVMLANTNN